MLYLKAIYAAVTAGVASTSTAYVAGGGHIGLVSGLTIAGAVLSAFGVVWGVPNQSK